MNFAALILSFVLGLGIVLTLISDDATSSFDESEMTRTTAKIMRGIGVVLMVIGTLGFGITIVDVLKRAHQRLAQGEKRKLEQQIEKKATRSATLGKISPATKDLENGVPNGGFTEIV
ncbi:unnamed protein product, partial [Mesorhabditis belari]|uniref:Uncharacterized protein n=1 Tax=Mesorhabditis belari TaxID=2138241 RepID=A0AAF3EYR1_9BILA